MCNKNLFLSIFTLIILNFSISFSQGSLQAFPLKFISDSTISSFNYIFPNKKPITVNIPPLPYKIYTLSRYLDFNSIGVKIPILIGEDIYKNRLIIIDENANNDLTDDRIIYFRDTFSTVLQGNYKRSEISLKRERNKKLETSSLSFDFTIIKPPKLNLVLSDSTENKFFLFIRPTGYKKAIVKVNGKNYYLFILTEKFYNYKKGSSFIITSIDSNAISSWKKEKFKFTQSTLGDRVLLGNQQFLLDSISQWGDTIFLRKSSTDIVGNKVGFYLPDLQTVDIQAKPITANQFKGKYLIIEFWGTWCVPCLSILKDLHQLNEDIKNKNISMLGISYDDDINKVKDFIKVNDIKWQQVFDYRQSKNSITSQLDIKAFPSFLMINPSGKIIFRDEGIDGFIRLKNYVSSLVK